MTAAPEWIGGVGPGRPVGAPAWDLEAWEVKLRCAGARATGPPGRALSAPRRVDTAPRWKAALVSGSFPWTKVRLIAGGAKSEESSAHGCESHGSTRGHPTGRSRPAGRPGLLHRHAGRGSARLHTGANSTGPAGDGPAFLYGPQDVSRFVCTRVRIPRIGEAIPTGGPAPPQTARAF